MARFATLLLLGLLALPVGAANPAALPGEWIDIPGADSDFRALLTSERAPALRGAAILIPDAESHPDRPGVSGTLRSGLAAHDFTGLDLALVQRVRGWLERQRRETAETPTPPPTGESPSQ